MESRNATVAVVGAGDYIGAAIATRFAAEGFTVFAGRRHSDKLAPLVAEIEARGGRIVARSVDARKEDDVTAFLQEADRRAPLEVCIFNVGANSVARGTFGAPTFFAGTRSCLARIGCVTSRRGSSSSTREDGGTHG